jgi:hypothetical protein
MTPSTWAPVDKIRLKGGPKQYKRGPRPRGRERLQRRVTRLCVEAHRLARHTPSANDRAWAHQLAVVLHPFTGARAPLMEQR